MRVLVTGGAGFIGSAMCRALVAGAGWSVLNLDKLTYAANEASLAEIANNARYQFVRGDICDADLVTPRRHRQPAKDAETICRDGIATRRAESKRHRGGTAVLHLSRRVDREHVHFDVFVELAVLLHKSQR